MMGKCEIGFMLAWLIVHYMLWLMMFFLGCFNTKKDFKLFLIPYSLFVDLIIIVYKYIIKNIKHNYKKLK
jgi:hypothetical protein